MNRQSIHRLPIERLGGYLAAHVDGFYGLRSAEKFSGGLSNPTYLLNADSGHYVLRRKPPGELLKSAHAVDREFRVIRALSGSNVPVAEAIHLCADDSVIGSMFYIMSYVCGRIFWNPALPELDRKSRGALYDEMNRVMAALHDFDVVGAGLEDYGRPGDYFARQISRWSRQYAASETETIKDMDELIRWLPENLPAEDGLVSLIHGDYRLDNLVFHPQRTEALALLDWELSTLGHPYADLAYQCMQWHLGHDEVMPGLGGLERSELGIPSEEAYVARYCERRGIDGIPHWSFYLAFGFFRFAAIMQGVYRRSLEGNASNTQASEYGSLIRPLARLGVAQIAP